MPTVRSRGPLPRHVRVNHKLAEQHEALWLGLAALHKDVLALGAKAPAGTVSEPVRIAAEGLLSDCAPFTRQRGDRFPVAAADLAGLAVQLGQALAGLEAWEALNTTWDERFGCRIWQLPAGYLPIMRLKPPAAALRFKRDDPEVIRTKFQARLAGIRRVAYEEGFAAGRAARPGPPPDPEAGSGEQSYPRLRRLD